MKYLKVVKGNFISRPNRFVANVLIDGKEERVHVKNTGRCKELLTEGATVYLEDFDGRMGTRKMRYDLIAVEKGELLINMDSQAPNKVAYEFFKDKVDFLKAEVTYLDSRLDLYFEKDGRKGFIEVKGVTLEEDGIARFPDAPTERGVKHIKHLIKAKEEGYDAKILFVVQMKGVKEFTPNDETHRAFGDALRLARKKGVEVLCYDCQVTPDSLQIVQKVALTNI
ncbi:MAG: DNA/RNA nuclease SfsA [Clostridia bacterium]|nr:DNA/RNA nuclease SfsA [Clostridia bacterium]